MRHAGLLLLGWLAACEPAGGDTTADAATTTGATDAAATTAATDTAATTAATDTAATAATDTAATTAATDTAATDTSGPDVDTNDPCAAPGLVWRTGNKTTYESYPDPGSEECIEFSGCDYVGQFAACDNTMPEAWVEAHDIAAVFPLGDLALHRLCIRAGARTMVVTAIDTCGDGDCDGCCTENRGDADALIDLESYTNARFGVEDGPIEWADLGPGDPDFDGCN